MVRRKEFDGYKAYDRLPRLADFRLFMNGQSVEGFSKSLSEMLTIVDSLALTFSIVESGKEPVPDSWDIDFAGFFDADKSYDPTMIISRNSSWAERKEERLPFDLVSAACHLAFSYNEDGDSYDTQQEEFENRFGFILLAHNNPVMIPLNGLILPSHAGAAEVPLFVLLGAAFFVVYAIEMAFFLPYLLIKLMVSVVRSLRKPRHEESGERGYFLLVASDAGRRSSHRIRVLMEP